MKMSQKAQTLALVRKLIDKRTEDKFISWENAPGVGWYTTGRAIGSVGSVIPLIREIQNGDDSYQRLGDKIRPKYLIVRGFIAIDKLVNVETAVRVRLMVVSNKSDKNANPAVAAALPLGALLNDNLAASAPALAHGFTGTPADDCSSINSAQFIAHSDKHYDLVLAGKNMGPPTLGTGAMAVYRYFKIKVKCPASLTFTDPNGDYPTNFAPTLLMGYSYPESWGFPVADPDPLAGQVRIYARSTLYYDDA